MELLGYNPDPENHLLPLETNRLPTMLFQTEEKPTLWPDRQQQRSKARALLLQLWQWDNFC